ncbi:MAG: GTPase ObgE [Kiritimatiellia bacterium]|nr:GTPase ObgE [Kiritimatiellia bacterium]
MKAPTFVDLVRISVHAGNGGNGVALFRREKFVPYGGPSGGDGGNGGSVYLLADKNQSSLLPLYYEPHQRAEHGQRGGSRQCTGRNGSDRIIPVPCGTTARDADTGEWVGEVTDDGQKLLIAQGGKGGLGNCHFATSTHQAPRECTPGTEGHVRRLQLELKLISEAGLVGLPNAGKSSILRKISDAHPRVAAYPFTTLHPNIGMVCFPDFEMCSVADIPGLIAGAHEGIGLGHDFLRHIERTRFLVLVIDLSGLDGRHPADDYFTLCRELEFYNPDLPKRPRMVVGNKIDLPEARANLPEFLARTGVEPLLISAETGEGLALLKERLHDGILATRTAPEAESSP